MIARSIRLQETQHLKKCRRDFSEIQFRFDIEHRIEIRQCKPSPRERVEFRSKLLHVCGGHRESARVRVSAVAREKTMRRFDRLEQMEGTNRTARSKRLFSIARNHDGRTMIALHHARSR